MKKRISLLLCVLIMALGLAGCSDKSDAASYDSETMESLAEFIISNFSQMEDADMDAFKELSDYQLDYTLMQSGLTIEGEDFIAMMDSWVAAEEECGAYVSHGDYEIEVKSDGYMVSTLAEYEERQATIQFSFNEKEVLESMDVSAKFSMGEILTKAGLNTLLGMGTVFAVLIFLAFVIGSMKYIPVLLDKLSKKNNTPAAEVKPAVVETAPVVEETDDLELVAVITAAIAAAEGTSSDGFVVRSIRRRPSNNWN
ncbi:MAG: OadG family protein [Tyzzerella sp.]|nr:OadG family protein [Tyzzerella sp.]